MKRRKPNAPARLDFFMARGDLELAVWYARALHMTGQPEKAEDVFNRALVGSTKEMAVWAVEWRKTWQQPVERAGQGAGAPAPAPASAP